MPRSSASAPDRKGASAAVIDDRPPSCVPSVDATWLADLAGAALDALDVPASSELTVTLVDAEQIAALNDEFLGGEGPTDVLSFPIDGVDGPGSLDGSTPSLLGDVVICPEVAAANAPAHAGTLDDELALLCVHGILHLLGHDHRDHDEAQVMRALEAQVVARVHRPVAAGTEVPT